MSKANLRKKVDLEATWEHIIAAGKLSVEDVAFLKRQRAEYDHDHGTNGTAKPDVAALLASCKFDVASPPAAPVALYKLGDNVIATAENLMVLQAKMKAGKSAAVGGMLAAVMGGSEAGDCLHFSASNQFGKAVLHFDTEQSRYDHYRMITRSMARAGVSVVPRWFYSYHVKGNSVASMLSMLEFALNQTDAACSGVHSVTIDGIGDMCADVNDAGEANVLVAKLESLAVKYRCVIICVLHENPGTDSGKTRGHLGSQLARKAETNLRLEKDAGGVTVMFADSARSMHVAKDSGYRFAWDEDLQCHVSTDSPPTKAEKAYSELRELANSCFPMIDPKGLRHCELLEAIRAHRVSKGVTLTSRPTLIRRVDSMESAGLIHKSPSGNYFRSAE
jgi:hypothetical protein